MIEELYKSIKEHVFERVANPLTGAITVFWIFCNYQFLLIVLSDEPVRRKMELISSIAYSPWWKTLVGFLGPIVLALIYLYIYSKPAQAAYEHVLRQKKKAVEARGKIDAKTMLTEEESEELKQTYASIEINYKAKRRALEREVERLNEQLRQVNEANEDMGLRLRKAEAGGRVEGVADAEAEELVNLRHELIVSKSRVSELESVLNGAMPDTVLDKHDGALDILQFLVEIRAATAASIAEKKQISERYVAHLLRELESNNEVEIVGLTGIKDDPIYSIAKKGVDRLISQGWRGR